jgi:RimJ/RimL family protein N-acetyltransferase
MELLLSYTSSNTGEWKSLDEASEWINIVTSKPNSFIFAVFLRDTSVDSAAKNIAGADQGPESVPGGKMIGVIGLSRWNTLHFLFERSTWGQGYCTEALKAYILALHSKEPSRPWLTAAIFPGNARSRRVLEKCGFTRWYREPDSQMGQSDILDKEKRQENDGDKVDGRPRGISMTEDEEVKATSGRPDVQIEEDKNTLINFRYNFSS